MMVVSEVCIIYKNLNWEECASKQVFPIVKPKDETHKFSVPYIVVPFYFSEFLGCSPNHEFLTTVILLKQGLVRSGGWSLGFHAIAAFNARIASHCSSFHMNLVSFFRSFVKARTNLA
jgi:hypothetical protein